ncbi:hypothetical protein HAX54_041423 [Datura stramonium]|uniref:Zinc finger GRF-type domain-containing protein n=1 Tax=Datura stramonium TaxID=4076 RepID=A0ABS8VSN6_DATST|nr:hypothetical protein [Datura stramonium]
MEEVRLDLNKLCMDYEDSMLNAEVRCSHELLLPLKTSWSDNNPERRFWSCPYYGAKKCKSFRWRDGLVDERSKFIISKLVKKMKDMNEELVSKVKKIKEMERMAAYNDSEIIEMMENSTVMEIEEESAFTMKELEEKSALTVKKMKDMEAKPMENSREKEIKEVVCS